MSDKNKHSKNFSIFPPLDYWPKYNRTYAVEARSGSVTRVKGKFMVVLAQFGGHSP